MTSQGVEECAQCARSMHGVHHAIVGVNVVNGVLVVHCELQVVVRVHVPLVVYDDAVIDLTLVLIALVVIIVFVVAIFNRILLHGRYLRQFVHSQSPRWFPNEHKPCPPTEM